MTSSPRREALTFLDGGLATQLEARGLDLDDPLWSGRALLDEPRAIAAVHADYVAAGADAVTTATYQLTESGLRARGLSDEAIDATFDRAIALAHGAARAADEARAAAGRSPVQVLGSIGPHGAAAADGSEYDGRYLHGPLAVHDDVLAATHRRRLEHLVADPRVDGLLLETMPGAREVVLVVQLIGTLLVQAEAPRRPFVWVSLQAPDSVQVADGQPLADALDEVLALDLVGAVGINCTHPRHGAAQVAALAAARSRRASAAPLELMVYPNAGEGWDAAAHAWNGDPVDPSAFADLARTWLDAGATILGGCCRTTPAHIAALAAAVP